MKFKLLSIGQKFEYEGDVYIKTSPLIATNVKTSHNKLIPRYALLTLLNETDSEQQALKTETLDAKETLNSFNLFYEKCISTLEKHNVLIPKIKNELDKARDEFTQHII